VSTVCAIHYFLPFFFVIFFFFLTTFFFFVGSTFLVRPNHSKIFIFSPLLQKYNTFYLHQIIKSLKNNTFNFKKDAFFI
jgi:hypothetical protein